MDNEQCVRISWKRGKFRDVFYSSFTLGIKFILQNSSNSISSLKLFTAPSCPLCAYTAPFYTFSKYLLSTYLRGTVLCSRDIGLEKVT